MRKDFFCLLLTGFISTALWASDKADNQTVHISGRIKSNTDSVRLMIGHWKNYLTGGIKERQVSYITPTGDGNILIRLMGIDHPCRAQITDILSNNVLFDNAQIIEPGDSIYFEATIHDQPEFSEENFTARFSGKGAAKYNCIQGLKLVDDVGIRRGDLPLSDRIRIADSLIAVKEEILSRYEKEINPQVYQIIRGDIIGGIRYTLLLVQSNLGKASDTDLASLEDFLSKPLAIADDAGSASVGYINFLYLKKKWDLVSKGKTLKLEQLYLELKSSYSGKLREKLLAFCLLNDLDMTTSLNQDCEIYTAYLKDAIGLIKTDWIRSPLEKVLQTRGKGAEAFNFLLLADTSGKKVSLADLKGKVVLVDMWGFICTGCYRFSNAFHKSIYPLFRDNPDFKVVSIMLDKYAGMKEYRQRLLGQNGPIYTYPDYINLYGGKGELMARNMEEHYNIQSFPFIVLIDRKGNIYSSTIPLIDTPEHPDVEKLIALIKKALEES